MNVRLVLAEPTRHATPLLVVPLYEDDEDLPELHGSLDALFEGVVSRARSAGDLMGRVQDSLVAYGSGDGPGPSRLLVLGAGKREAQDAESIRRLAGKAVRAAERLKLDRVTLWLEAGGAATDPAVVAQAGVEGAVLAGWEYRELKTREDESQEEEAPHACVETVEVAGGGDPDALKRGMEVGAVLARAENFARTLQSRPGNVATPTHLADVAAALAEKLPLEVRVLGPEELKSESMHALLAVSQGSEEEPRLIVMTYRGSEADQPPLALVGKGLTFDAGGISLKPASGMEDMKFDMSGGAAVIAAMGGIAELKLPVNVVGIVPSSENLPSGSALKPGDVIPTREGKSVEVVNTDAEGRLILADALSYARSLSPSAIVDCATLTGACVIALGHDASGVLGTDEGLVQELRDAGDRSGERCWPLPLWKEYGKQLESTVADLKNVGGRAAGTVTAASFLKAFVGDCPWAHLDIAGTAYGEGKLSYQRKGALGVPTRLLLEWVRGRAG
jgi:leucyl aminopeptidase